MKILHIATIDIGGAYKAATRLHEGLLSFNVDSSILLRTKTNPSNIGQSVFKSSLGQYISKTKNLCNLFFKDGDISRDILGTDISKNELVQDADLIILHWINSFLTPKEIKKIAQLNKPVMCFMHDMWLFTGGCHVDAYCGKYENGCGKCPMIHDGKKHKDISEINFREKKNLMENTDIFIAGPSKWIVECAKKSDITNKKEIYHIPNMLNTRIFHPIVQKDALYSKYCLDPNKKTILFGAADTGTENENKGFRYLLEAIDELPRNQYQLMIFGNSNENMKLPSGFDVSFRGFISDEDELVSIYNAADVFVNPSNQESFGYTVCEAMACATPVVCFPVGGLKEQVRHKENGYIADFRNPKDLAKGIEYCTQNRQRLGENARKSSMRFSYENVTPQYIELFQDKIFNINKNL